MTGRKMNEFLSHLHFWPSLIFMIATFTPMLIMGLAGVSRRLYDGGETYAHAQDVLPWNMVTTMAAYSLALAQIPFLINLFWSAVAGKKVGRNPWEATTLEWATTSPPLAHGNFETVPVVHRGPYEYSVPGAATDFSPQHEPEESER